MSAAKPYPSASEDAPERGAPAIPDDGVAAPSPADEARWLALVPMGDQVAFAEMFRAYAERLAVYAYALVDSYEIAEEIVQDIFFAIWQRREQWLVQGTLKQYLYASTRNRAFDVLKRRRTQRQIQLRALREDLPPAMGDTSHEPLAAIEREELSVRVREALHALPEQQRAVIHLRWIGHLTHAEIARVLGISVKTSENHANRAMQRLRQLLAALRAR